MDLISGTVAHPYLGQDASLSRNLLMNLRRSTCLRALVATLALNLTSSNPATSLELQSGQHDRLIVRILDGDAWLPTAEPDDATRLVHVCVRDKAASGRRKAFDSRRGLRARFVVPFGGWRCARFEPTRQVFYFSKNSGEGLRVVLSYRVNLKPLKGAILLFDWVQDSPR